MLRQKERLERTNWEYKQQLETLTRRDDQQSQHFESIITSLKQEIHEKER